MTDTRERIVQTTAELFRRQGYTGTGLKQIVAAAGAPFGSIYHFFPGGKQQLGQAVIVEAGMFYQRLVESVVEAAPDIVTGIHDMFAGAAAALQESGYADACPIGTVALEVASTNELLRQATAEVFESWVGKATEWFVGAGLGHAAARDLAMSVICGLEGGFMLSRALRSTAPMLAAGATAADAVRAALGR